MLPRHDQRHYNDSAMDNLLNFIPEGLRKLMPDGVWYVVLGSAALLALLLALSIIRRLFRRAPSDREPNLEERFADYPPLKPSSGDRRLTVEGVPVRLRLVVVAQAGTESDVDEQHLGKLLERILPGLGAIFEADKPRVRIWPMQLSYQGFTKHLHRNTILPEGEHQLSKWVVVAGRAKLDEGQIMLGLGLEAIKPTTVGRRTIDAHEWPVLLRVRVRD
jgi:hypothetical protein